MRAQGYKDDNCQRKGVEKHEQQLLREGAIVQGQESSRDGARMLGWQSSIEKGCMDAMTEIIKTAQWPKDCKQIL